jgi:hypothetical protein
MKRSKAISAPGQKPGAAPLKPKLHGAAVDPALGRKGGSVTASQSRAKARALKALHAERRGRRINATGLTVRELDTLMGDLATLLRTRWERGRISAKAAARACGVSDRTVHRWLEGIDWPHSRYIWKLQAWMRKVSTGSKPPAP